MTDIQAAIMLATRGKQFSEIENAIFLYNWAWGEFLKIEKRANSDFELVQQKEPIWTPEKLAEYHRDIKNIVGEHELQLSRLFLNAIKARDSEKFFEIAKAIEFFKKFKAEERDRNRELILHIKRKLDKKGERWTVSRLAKTIGWPKQDVENGFFSLKRMAKRLGFPLKISTQLDW